MIFNYIYPETEKKTSVLEVIWLTDLCLFDQTKEVLYTWANIIQLHLNLQVASSHFIDCCITAATVIISAT